MNPLGSPGLTLPEDGWVHDPTPGLYWTRYTLDDGTKTQPVFCVVTPTGPVETHACWAWTPNFGDHLDHPSTYNYFVEEGVEFFPFTQEFDSGALVRFDIVARAT